MRLRLIQLLSSSFPPVLALIAFVFSVLTITSKDWALRDNYDESLLVTQWKTPLFTLSRSPFRICDAIADNTKPVTYTISCQNFRPFGFNRTSCELGIATGSDSASNFGDARWCQQIHRAGNFGIASLTFITLGFILTGLLAIGTFLTLLFPGVSSTSHETKERSEAVDTGNIQHPDSSKPVAAENQNHPQHHEQQRHHRRRGRLAPYFNLLLVVFLVVGAITGVISQFYGVLGLIQSAPNNADFAGSGSTDTSSGTHGPWYEGRGLRLYPTLAWGFSLAGGWAAGLIWRLPRLDKVL